MDTNETCDVLPTGYLTGTLPAAQARALALSGAIPAAYVRERAATVLGVAFVTGALVTAPVWYLTTWVLTHLI